MPDHINSSTVTRSFLLSLLYNIRREKYINLYNIYKQHKKQISTGNKKIYYINIHNSFAGQLQNYENETK